jgi:hypothetical protein
MKPMNNVQNIIIIDPLIMIPLIKYIDVNKNSKKNDVQNELKVEPDKETKIGYDYYEHLIESAGGNTFFLISDFLKLEVLELLNNDHPVSKQSTFEMWKDYIADLQEENILIRSMETYQDDAFKDILGKYIPWCFSNLKMDYQEHYLYSGALMYQASEILVYEPKLSEKINSIRTKNDKTYKKIATKLLELTKLEKRDQLPSAKCFRFDYRNSEYVTKN